LKESFVLKAAQKLFSNKGTPFLFLMMSKKADNFDEVADAFRAVAKENSGKIIGVFLNTEDPSTAQVINYLGVKEADYPTYRLLNLDLVSFPTTNDWMRL